MKIKARLNSIAQDYSTRKYTISLDMIDGNIAEIEKYKDKDLAVEIKQYRKARSLDANAMLWACLGDISAVTGIDKWSLYIKYLRECGQYTMIDIKAEALPMFKRVYRECELVGSRYVDGEEILQVLCYYGSSNYDSKEFSILLDKVISDMKEAGLDVPTSKEMERALEIWQNEQEIKKRVHR